MADRTGEEVVRDYLVAVARGDAEAVEPLLGPEMTVTELPNALKPLGGVRDRGKVLVDLARAGDVVTAQSWDILTVTASGDRVVVEATWRGTLAVPVGELKAGGAMACRSAMVFDLEDGLIAAQRNYDCFEPA